MGSEMRWRVTLLLIVALSSMACVEAVFGAQETKGWTPPTDNLAECESLLLEYGDLGQDGGLCDTLSSCDKKRFFPWQESTGSPQVATSPVESSNSTSLRLSFLQMRARLRTKLRTKLRTGTMGGPPDLAWVKPNARGTMFTPRKFHRVVQRGADKLYVFGGCEFPDMRCKNDTFELNMDGLTWKRIETKGVTFFPRLAMTATAYRDKVLVFGGYNTVDGVYEDTVMSFSYGTNMWSVPAIGGDTPPGRAYHSGAAVPKDNRIIYFGGSTDEQFFDDLVVLNAGTMEWMRPEAKGNKPSARKGHSATIIDKFMYVFGGYVEESGTVVSDLHILNINSYKWKTFAAKGHPPMARESHGAVALGKKLYIYGGCQYDPPECYSAVDVLDTEKMRWERVEPTPTWPSSREGFSMNRDPADDARVIVIGGCFGDRKCYDDVYEMFIDGCPNHCSGQGKCKIDKQRGEKACVCDPGWTGGDCSEIKRCAPSPVCSHHGVCEMGKCTCDPGFSGEDCGFKKCPHDCLSRGACRNGRCDCNPGWVGASCEFPLKVCEADCNMRGQCVNGTCVCEEGYGGDACETKLCPSGCSQHGICQDSGQCFCDVGWWGAACEQEVPCPNQCSGRGSCVNQKCVCVDGFTGKDCSYAIAAGNYCPNNCSGHGNCDASQGVCDCFEGWGGDMCSHPERKCPEDCNNRGDCDNNVGECQCQYPYYGKACENKVCPEDCNGNGICIQGTCMCDEPFAGPTCSIVKCPNDCNHHGTCDHGRCKCVKGFSGDDCGRRMCPNDCSGHGDCLKNGQCQCDHGWTGGNCNRAGCPTDCSKHGFCEGGNCICDPGYVGEDCMNRACPLNCSAHGICDNKSGKCDCNVGWSGLACNRGSLKMCGLDCDDHGTCIDGVCKCSPGWAGDECNVQVCPRDCAGHGVCKKGACACDRGYNGTDCTGKIRCPGSCSGHGDCNSKTGDCSCIKGFSGLDCSFPNSCPANCSGNGVCNEKTGICACQQGWSGEMCNHIVKSCDKECVHGSCSDGVCACDDGWYGDTCSLLGCKDDCNWNGICQDNGKCVCDPGFAGDSCGQKVCMDDCNGRGKCVDGECQCNDGFAGPSCGRGVCKKDCHGHGTCEVNKDKGLPPTCNCDNGFVGKWCGKRMCPGDCSGHGDCAKDGICTCDDDWTGDDCSIKLCPKNCNQMGTCRGGKCQCYEFFQGEDCGQRACPQNCTGHGRCDASMSCMCEYGYKGAYCEKSLSLCPNACMGHGRCIGSICSCEQGWTGINCGTKVYMCPKGIKGLTCSGKDHGICDPKTRKVCKCLNGWTGKACSEKECNPPDCNSQGTCNKKTGKCICEQGYSGEGCDQLVVDEEMAGVGEDGGDKKPQMAADVGMPGDAGFKASVAPTDGSSCGDVGCNEPHGFCYKSTCYCEPGYGGAHCEHVWCNEEIVEKDCKQQGTCVNANCVCYSGYAGTDCHNVIECPKNCSSDQGFCKGGECYCIAGYTGSGCEEDFGTGTIIKQRMRLIIIYVVMPIVFFIVGFILCYFAFQFMWRWRRKVKNYFNSKWGSAVGDTKRSKIATGKNIDAALFMSDDSDESD